MPRKLLSASLLAALAAALPIAPALATTSTAQAPITVEGKHVRQTGTSVYDDVPIDTYSAKAIVHYGDLNLASLAGRQALRGRVEAAALSACDQIDQAFPVETEGNGNYRCVKHAKASAKGQVQAAIAAAA